MGKEERFAAVVSHVAGIFLPILGPLVIVIGFGKVKLVRLHASVAVAVSTVWVVAVVLIISVDKGRFSIEEEGTSPLALVALSVAFILVMTVALLNIRRAKMDLGPVGTPG
jgi:hypothetical protein